jgi:hypothetical protein
MPSESIGSDLVGTLPLARKLELIVVHDEYDYPAAARCSSCGKAMPVSPMWIASSAENLAWFADQFWLHVKNEHPGWSGTESAR